MVFSSLLFVFIFLPVVMILYFLSKEEYRNYILLVASLLFYAYGEPKFIFVMIGLIIINYGIALWIDLQKRRKFYKFARNLLIIDILINIGILFIFKYLDFTISTYNFLFHRNLNVIGVALPIGISFFIFQALSYVVDVYRGTVEVQKNLLYVALYISFFPQLIAGPIVRYSTIAEQISRRVCNLEKFAEGGRRFLLGFAKKVILANNLSVIATEIFIKDIQTTNPLLLWVGSVCYSLQIFYDFSGYSDMAIGLGKIFGFELEENFNYPYISRSVTEFWRRWHISLGQWFRDYLYIPLGGSRVAVPRHIFNMFVVWALTGIWHGARYTFIVWGLGYFILLVIEKYLVKPEKRKNRFVKIIWQIVLLLCVNFGWVIFNSGGIRSGFTYCAAMLGIYHNPFVVDGAIIRYAREYGFFIIAGILFATPIAGMISSKIKGSRLESLADVVIPVGYGFVFLWAVSYIILGAHNPFIYFNF
ncbi:MAG: MBOAT family protein [Lachnospiraceae bacterium]|nr:MBOAT family protein [Lachnospiraceae bacterium]